MPVYRRASYGRFHPIWRPGNKSYRGNSVTAGINDSAGTSVIVSLPARRSNNARHLTPRAPCPVRRGRAMRAGVAGERPRWAAGQSLAPISVFIGTRGCSAF